VLWGRFANAWRDVLVLRRLFAKSAPPGGSGIHPLSAPVAPRVPTRRRERRGCRKMMKDALSAESQTSRYPVKTLWDAVKSKITLLDAWRGVCSSLCALWRMHCTPVARRLTSPHLLQPRVAPEQVRHGRALPRAAAPAGPVPVRGHGLGHVQDQVRAGPREATTLDCTASRCCREAPRR